MSDLNDGLKCTKFYFSWGLATPDPYGELSTALPQTSYFYEERGQWREGRKREERERK